MPAKYAALANHAIIHCIFKVDLALRTNIDGLYIEINLRNPR